MYFYTLLNLSTQTDLNFLQFLRICQSHGPRIIPELASAQIYRLVVVLERVYSCLVYSLGMTGYVKVLVAKEFVFRA